MDKNSLTGAILIVLIWIVFSTFFLNSGNENKREIEKEEELSQFLLMIIKHMKENLLTYFQKIPNLIYNFTIKKL